jgi:two-component system nitrogen regulation response regulator GlnG
MERERRILVIDDDEAIRTLLFTVLRRRGFTVDRARNGEEAIEAMQRCRYAVALVDLMMPIKNGWDVLDWMGTQPKSDRPLAIVLTAGIASRAMSADVVVGTIRKPFDVELLLDIVAACADGRAVEQNNECPPPQSNHIRERPRGGDVN